jgi:tetratricopeptide (TPR) repeat protein
LPKAGTAGGVLPREAASLPGAAATATPSRRTERKTGAGIPWFRAALVIALALGGFHEVQLWDEVQARARSAATEPLDSDRLWNDYQELRGRAWSNQTTARLGRVVSDRFTAAAIETLRGFREDEPAIRLRQYTDARELLSRALEIDASRATTQAWYEDAEGHIARIAGEDRRGEPRADRRRQKLQQAVSHFEEAARLDPRLPDPYLGLARIYTYSMRSPLLARQALGAAAERGLTLGRREHAQLGDLLDADGRDLYRQARQVRGSTAEEPALMQARDQFRTALEEYSQGGGFGDADVNARRVRQVLSTIEARVAAIHVETEPAPTAAASSDEAEQPGSDAERPDSSEAPLQSL